MGEESSIEATTTTDIDSWVGVFAKTSHFNLVFSLSKDGMDAEDLRKWFETYNFNFFLYVVEAPVFIAILMV